MQNESNIRKFTADALRARRARGESRSDLQAVRDKTETELERDIASDPDFRDIPADWFKDAEAVMPRPKRPMSIRLDDGVIEWFKAQGPGYQTRINAVLVAFVRAAQKVSD